MAQSRMTISLPKTMAATVEAVSRTEQRSRSEVVREALRGYLPRRAARPSGGRPSSVIRDLGFANKAALARALKEGAKKRSGRDQALAAEWFAVDDEAWRNRAKD